MTTQENSTADILDETAGASVIATGDQPAAAPITSGDDITSTSKSKSKSESESESESKSESESESDPAPIANGDNATTSEAVEVTGDDTASEAAETNAGRPACNNIEQADGSSNERQPPHNHHRRQYSGPSRAQQHRDLWADARLDEFRAAFAAHESIIVTAVEQALKMKDGKPIAISGHRVETDNGLAAFLPISEMQKGVRQKRITGHTFAVKIIALEYSERDGVTFKVSREKALKDVRKSIVDGLKAGDKVDGHVVDEHEHGFFVNIGSDGVFPGLVRCWLSKARVPTDEAGNPMQYTKGTPVSARVSVIENGQVKLTMTTKQERAAGQASDSRGEQRNDGGQRRDRQQFAGHRSHGNTQRHERREEPVVETAPVSSPADEAVATTAAVEPAAKPASSKKKVRHAARPKPVNHSTDGGIQSNNLADFGKMWKARFGAQQPAATAADSGAQSSQTEVTPTATETGPAA